MADIRQPFPQPPSTGRELVARPNFTIPGADAPQMSAATPRPDNAMPSRPSGRDLVVRPNFTMGGNGAPPKPAPMPSTGGLRQTLYNAGKAAGQAVGRAVPGMESTIGAVKNWSVGTADPKAVGTLAKAKDLGGRTLQGLGRAAGLYNVGDSVAQNAKGLYNVFDSDAATTSDKFAAGVEAAGNVVGTGALNFYGKGKLGAVGPVVSGAVGPNPASRLVDLADSSVLDKFNPDGGFGKTRTEQLLDPSKPAAPDAGAGRSTPGFRDVRRLDYGDAGDGRATSGFKDPRIVADPATSLRKDFSGELAGVPQNLPSGLEDGRVYKTADANGRTVYSGRNVRENAGVVDGQGGLRGYLGGGNPEPATDAQGRRLDGRPQEFVTQGSAQPGAQAAATGQPPAAQNVVQAGASPSSFGLGGSDAAISQARQAAADRGDWDAVSRSYGEAPQGGPSLRMGGGGYSAGPSVAPHVAQSEKFAQQVARSNAESAAMAAIKSGSVRERGRGMATLAQLAGGDQDAATSRYNTDATTATSRYGSDNSLRGSVYSADSQNASSRYTADMGLRGAYAKSMPAQAQRQAQAMAMQMAGGDIPTALKIMAQQGYSGEGLIATQGALNSDQTTQQNLSEGARKNAAARFGQFMQTDGDGKPVAGAEGALLNSMESIIPGSTQMREDQLAAPVDLGRGVTMSGQAAVTAGLNVLKGLNTTNDNAFLQSIGWDPKNPRLDQLPDLNGAKLDRVGLIKGGLKGGNVSSGNYQLDLGGGRVLYLPHDQIGENELALLRARGVNVPK